MSAPSVPRIEPRPDSSNQSLRFYWASPTSDGGAPILKYTLACSAIAYTQDLSANIDEYLVTGLTNGTNLTFTLTATNANGTSPAATFRTVQTGVTPFGPTSTVASTLNASTALVSWNLSTIADQAAVRAFLITVLPSTASMSSFKKTAYADERQRALAMPSTNISYQFLVQAINDVGYCSPFAYTSSLLFRGPTTPADIAGLVAWYDAADSATVTVTSGKVTQWADKSGNSRHATATTAYGPAYSGGGINFGTGPGRLQCTLPMNPAHTVFVVASPSALQESYFFRQSGTGGGFPCLIYGYGGNNRISIYGSSLPQFTTSPGSKYLISYTYAGNPVNSTTGYYNNTLVGTVAQEDIRDSGYTYGNINALATSDPNGTTNQFGGSFFDFAFYNSALTPSQTAELRSYFISKWGIT